MSIKQTTRGRHLRLERLENRLALSAATDFIADFAAGLPQNNPNGEWTYLGPDGATSSLTATNGTGSAPGPDTHGVGAGWAAAAGHPSFARGGTFGFPAQSIAGHGPMTTIWTAPADFADSGVELSGFLTQASFEADRQMQLRIFKNDSFTTPVVMVDANFVNQTAVVTIPETRVAINPRDTLRIIVDGGGPLGNGISTFAAWDLDVQRVRLPGDYNGDAIVDQADYTVWKQSFGQFVTPGAGADGNLNGQVDAADYMIWYDGLGNALPSGEDPPAQYHPAAIVVQTTGVTLPDGTILDTSSSQTHGLQEAFDFSAEQGWDVFVLPGTYQLDEHLDVEELQGRAFRLEDVTLDFSANVTDFGIRFDSTMITDWYWQGGSLNAPHATSGVLFQPRTPHPLDGPKFGTVGVVDSRFDFGVDIDARGWKVTMSTNQAAVNDVAFHFKDVPPSEILFVGQGFSPTNIFSAPRTDDPIPFDLFTTTNRVTVVPPLTDISSGFPATIFKPDGSTISVASTQTFGLQEAFDYAGENDLDVLVFGRGVRNVAPFTNLGLYNLSSGLTVSPLVERTYRMYSVTFNYTANRTAMAMSDIVRSDFELTGQIVGVTAETGVAVQPITAGVTDSVVRIQHVVGSDTNVLIDPSLQSVENSEFYLHEMNIGQFGITIANPSSTTFFRNNFIRTLHTHAMSRIGLQLGISAANSSRITSNIVEMRTNTDSVPGQASLQVWGDFNTVDFIALGPGLNIGAKFETGSNNNTLIAGPIEAATTILDLGVDNDVVSSSV